MIEQGYEIVEHTADIGIRAFAPSLEATFEQAAWGLAEILGAVAKNRDREQAPSHEVRATASDRDALLVDFLNELLLLHETQEVAFASIHVRDLTDCDVTVEVGAFPIPGETETTGVKAATYHRLEVREIEGGFEARVYLDV